MSYSARRRYRRAEATRGRQARRIGLLVVILLLAAAGLWTARPRLAAWVEAAQVLDQLAHAEDGYLAPEPVRYQVDGRQRQGDLYRLPTHPPGGTGLVIVPGAAEGGKDDTRLRNFAGTLAEAGFTVLVPDIPSQKALQVGPENAQDIADAVDWLSGSQRRVGVAAISYAVGPAVLAGLQEGPKLAFIVGVGGYYDLGAVIGFFTTGLYFEDGKWQKRTPNAYGKWVFVRSNAARLWDSGDRTLLEVMASRKISDRQAPVDDLVKRLTPTGRSIYDLLANAKPQRVPALIDGLPPMVRDDIKALDLKSRDLSGLSAHLLLIHGRNDAIVPAGESRKLAAAVPSARLFLVDDLAHADWSPKTLASTLTLLSAMHALLVERDRGLSD